ncbi:hypothetical protein OSB04_031705 [Centaurea solstitialis]|uniref:Uncharacterized protein n=1 Tax=Centaurea solstitialis TaxID=347529 RepID=A0AA38VUL5_9ASTR|nr:hypothetical protein OSB04_031705 [Centaurea solstitialis]
MDTAHLPGTIIRPNSGNDVTHRRLKPPGNSVFFLKQFRNRALLDNNNNSNNRSRIIRLSLVEQIPPKSTKIDVERLVDFLYEDLPHLFDDQGIDRTAYDEQVKFRDPITKLDGISCYLFNIALLKLVFSPNFELHSVKKLGDLQLKGLSGNVRICGTPLDYSPKEHSVREKGGPYELTTRWTVEMTFSLLPWKPLLVLTGTSVMGINPENGKFCSHVDYWDSLKNNEYFSSEGLVDLIKQLQIYKTPDLETPKYKILKRTATYESNFTNLVPKSHHHLPLPHRSSSPANSNYLLRQWLLLCWWVMVVARGGFYGDGGAAVVVRRQAEEGGGGAT